MLTASRALSLNATASPELPRVPELRNLYAKGFQPRQGNVCMIAGIPGSQKSGFTLFWVAKMGLPTLYLSADMTGFQASVRLACMQMGRPTEVVEDMMLHADGRREVLESIEHLPISFSFGTPITWRDINENLDAFVEVHNSFPSVVVFDNLMDVEGCESDYTAQMQAMQDITSMARDISATTIVLHHATDKADTDPAYPPARKAIKGGMAEKPEVALTVALDPGNYMYRVAIVKQRMGFQDSSARTYATLQAQPELTRFHSV